MCCIDAIADLDSDGQLAEVFVLRAVAVEAVASCFQLPSWLTRAMARLGCRGFWLSLAVGASGLRLSGWRFWLTPWLCGFWLAPGLCPLLGLAHTLAAPSSGARLGCWGFWLSLVVGASGSSLGCVACGLRLGCSGFLLTPWLFQTWTRIILIRSQPLTREPCPPKQNKYIYIYMYIFPPQHERQQHRSEARAWRTTGVPRQTLVRTPMCNCDIA